MNEQTRKNWRHWFRRGTMSAAEALERVRRGDLVADSSAPDRDARLRLRHILNPLCEVAGRSARWIECPEALGFEFIGFADEIDTSINHRGWFLYDEGIPGEVARGAVYALKAGGRMIYLGAILDPHNDDGSALFDWDPVIVEPIPRGERYSLQMGCYGSAPCSRAEAFEWKCEDAKDTAAGYADSFAERYAEQSRDNDSAFQAGCRYSELGDEVKDERRNLLTLLGELKRARTGKYPAICDALRGTVRGHLETIRKARAKRAELVHNASPDYYDTFNDGAGETVFAVEL